MYTFRVRFEVMSVPLTTRLSEETIASLDKLVAAGRAPSKGAIVAEAVRLWLDRHDEDAIAASYRRAYADPDAEREALLDALADASAECLADR
jgi:Arc/MetJ-type ribon-helix-helix transcriptional regulator